MIRPRWDPSVTHRAGDAEEFIKHYFNDKKTLLISGAGFDPRSSKLAEILGENCKLASALLIKEQRPTPSEKLSKLADENTQKIRAAIPTNKILEVRIFGTDGAVVGGRNATNLISSVKFDEYAEVIIDISALSVGITFPIIRMLVEEIEFRKARFNLHVFAWHDAAIDTSVVSTPGDAPDFVHGFKGGYTLDEKNSAAKLWLPQLSRGKQKTLGRLFEFLAPHDTCPIMPFPASNPRLGDELAAEFISELEDQWEVDTRNIVFAAEDDPLDLYRTILRLDDSRARVFAEVGGSVLVLSPVGSKILALGTLMAALERDLPVAYVEAHSYDLRSENQQAKRNTTLIHVWLEGVVYPSPRPRLRSSEFRDEETTK